MPFCKALLFYNSPEVETGFELKQILKWENICQYYFFTSKVLGDDSLDDLYITIAI